ncbi:MAG: tripartite tricarboxylate transporter TctB family protein [Thermodesulfobacteriota bacterium]
MQQERLKNPRVRISLICAVILAALAAAIAVIILLTLKLTHPTTVLGPGFYPLLLSILMFVSSLYIIYSLLYGDSDRVAIKTVLDFIAVRKPLGLYLGVILCVAAMPVLGFVGSLFLFSFAEMTFLEKIKQPLFWRLIYSTAIAGGVFLLFNALQVYLPVPFWL